MKLLAIETSCDETAVSVVERTGDHFVARSHLSATQIPTHRKHGGVVPEVAGREHAITIIPTIAFAMQKAKVAHNNIDAIAVTAGPGLMTALVVGVETAKALAFGWNKPLIAVNHIEGHIFSTWPVKGPGFRNVSLPKFPALALIVSGGHTELLHVHGWNKYKLLGSTRDDAAGEVFDKVAKMLKLPYPGGPIIQKLAKHGNSTALRFPRPMIDKPNLEFSFAGLKTSVLYFLQNNKQYAISNKRFLADLCASFQQAVVDVLVAKTLRAAQREKVRSVLLAGGVAANDLLRTTLKTNMSKLNRSITLHVAPLPLCTDNATMIAMAGSFAYKPKRFARLETLSADPNWEIGR